MKPQVSIIILNWNGYKDTVECISSLEEIDYENCQIVLVDNGSDINEAEILEKVFSTIKTIRSDKNLGFSGGNNVGINYALSHNADYILLLNNDTIVERNFLEPLMKKILEDKQVGIISPQINYYSEPNRIWSAGGKISKIRASGFADSIKLESQLSTKDREVDFVSGCCMLVRRRIFEKVGTFDENYFLYVEDTDLCYRTKKAGFKIVVTPKSKIFHKVNRSTKENFSALPLYYATRNRLYFAKKNFRATFYLTLVYMLIVMTIKSIYWIIFGQDKYVKAIILAFKDSFDNKMGKIEYTKFISSK
jgi:GT2 family glycosyltransferase